MSEWLRKVSNSLLLYMCGLFSFHPWLKDLLQPCKPEAQHKKGSYAFCGVTRAPGMVLMEFQLCESKGTLNLHF